MSRNGGEFEPKVWHGIGCVLFVLLAGIGGCTAMADYTVSEGMRLGTINKFSRKGYVWKTYEGELTMAGLTAGTASGANVWDFSIDHNGASDKEKELADKLTVSAEKGERVKIKYRQIHSSWPWRSETDYLVVSVEPCVETPEKK